MKKCFVSFSFMRNHEAADNAAGATVQQDPNLHETANSEAVPGDTAQPDLDEKSDVDATGSTSDAGNAEQGQDTTETQQSAPETAELS